MVDRYDTSSTTEGQYQPGSDDKVLLNKLGISDMTQMEELEFDLLGELQEQLLKELGMDQRISAQELCSWHRRWLRSVYNWAGKYRSVNIGRGGFTFAGAHLIPKLMADFEHQYLDKYTPCNELGKDVLIEALAICHVELVLIHPFREGNGRLARLLATVMVLQTDGPLLDFKIMEQDKDCYIQAIHAGHEMDYKPMKQIFSEILKDSLR